MAASGSPAQALPQLPPDFFDKPGRGGSSGSTAAPAAELPADFFEKPAGAGAGAKAKPASAFQQFKQGFTESLHPQSRPNAGMAERFVNSTVGNFGDAASALAHGHPLDAAGDLLAGYGKAYTVEGAGGALTAGANAIRTGTLAGFLTRAAVGGGAGYGAKKLSEKAGVPEAGANLIGLGVGGLAAYGEGKIGAYLRTIPEDIVKSNSWLKFLRWNAMRGQEVPVALNTPKSIQEQANGVFEELKGRAPATEIERAQARGLRKKVMTDAAKGPEPWKPNKPTSKPNTPKYPGPQPSGQGPGYKGVGMSGAPPLPEKAPAEPWKPNAVNPNILKRYGKYPGPQRSGEGTAYRRVGMTGPKYPEAEADVEETEAKAKDPAEGKSDKTDKVDKPYSFTHTDETKTDVTKQVFAKIDEIARSRGANAKAFNKIVRDKFRTAHGHGISEASYDELLKFNETLADTMKGEGTVPPVKKPFGSERGSLSLAPSGAAKIEAGRAGRAHGSKLTNLFESSDRGIERPPLPGEAGTPGAPVPKVPGKLIGRTTGRELGVDKTPYKAGFGIYEVPIDRVIGTEDISGSPDKLRDAAEYLEKIKAGSQVPPLWGHVDESGNVSIQGARRLLAAKRAGLKTVPVAIGQDYVATSR